MAQVLLRRLHNTKFLKIITGLIYRYSKAIVLIVGASFLFLMMIARLPDNRHCINLDLDCSWVIDGQAKLLQGVISGRDYYFTYGPLGQAIVSVGAILRPNVEIIDRLPLLLVGFHILTILLIVTILACIPFANWRTSLVTLVVLFAVVDFNLSTRPLISTLSVVLIARALSTHSSYTRNLLCFLVGTLALIGQLVTFEIGPLIMIVSISLIIVVLLLRTIGNITEPSILTVNQSLRAMAILTSTYLIGNLLVSVLFKLSSPEVIGLFDYQYYNFELANSYSHTMVTPWVLDTTFAVVISLMLIYIISIIVISFKSISANRQYLYIGLGGLAALQLKSALIRNDLGHVVLAITPLIILFLLVTYESQAQKSFRVIGILLTLALIAAPPWAGEWIKSSVNSVTNLSIIRERLHMVRTFEVSPSEIASDELIQVLDAQSYILNFPYENIIAVALKQKNISPIIQAYSAHNTMLQQYYINQVEKVKNQTEVIYCTNSVLIDGVEHITRSPLIFDYLLRNFELKNNQLHLNGCVVLKPRQKPIDLPLTINNFETIKNDEFQRLVLSNTTDCTLVRIKMSIDYPPTIILGRAAPVEVQVMHDTVQVALQRIIPIEVGEDFETYVYLKPTSTSYKLFEPLGRADYAEQIDSLIFKSVPFGPLEVQPRDVIVKEIGCVNTGTGVIDPIQVQRNEVIGPILSENIIQQEFLSNRSGLSGIYIQMATYQRKNNSDLTFSLYSLEKPNLIVAQETINTSTLVDNEFFLFNFDKQMSKGNHYILKITSNANENQAVTIWTQEGDPYTDGKLIKNGQLVEADISFKLLYSEE